MEENKDVLVSVVMATYNRSKFIGRGIKSVLDQTYKNLELIIVDDNANILDERRKTEEVVQSFNDERIKYIKNEINLGGAATRNVGIYAARGQYISFLDDDDMYLPDKLKVEVCRMIDNNWDFCCMDGATFDLEENPVSERHQKLRNGMSKEDLIRVNLIYQISGTNSFMFRASTLKNVGGFDDVPSCHEFFLVQKVLETDAKVGYIPEIQIRNYMHPGGQISTSFKKLAGMTKMLEWKKKYFHLLTKNQKNYVLCRYYGVSFFVYFKNKKYGNAFSNAIRCFFTSPKQAWIWANEYKHKII